MCRYDSEGFSLRSKDRSMPCIPSDPLVISVPLLKVSYGSDLSPSFISADGHKYPKARRHRHVHGKEKGDRNDS